MDLPVRPGWSFGGQSSQEEIPETFCGGGPKGPAASHPWPDGPLPASVLSLPRPRANIDHQLERESELEIRDKNDTIKMKQNLWIAAF